MSLQDEEQWRCTCAHPEQGEVEEGQKERRRSDTGASMRIHHTAVGSIAGIDWIYLASIQVDAASIFKKKKN
jgi:hypothetical protein